MLTTRSRISKPAIAASVLCLLAGLFFANRFLINEISVTQTPDELIPMRTIQHMAQAHALDTDWAHANLPEDFRRVHFNFSGYVVASFAFVALTSPHSIAHDDRLLAQLRKFSRLATLCLVLFTFFALRRPWGTLYALLAAVAVLLVPLTFQDAHYARPEAFGSLLFTSCFLLAAQPNGQPHRDVARGALVLGLCGVLISIKVTYALATVFVLPILWPYLRAARNNPEARAPLAWIGMMGAAAFLIGLAVGMPYALRHPGVYLEGLHALQTQYAGLHPPHSLAEYSFSRQASWILAYFVSTIGVIALLLHPIGYGVNAARPAMFAFLAVLLTTLLLFMSQHVFFERNMSHLAPSFIIVSVGGIRTLMGLAAKRYPLASPLRGAGMAALSAVLFLLLLRTSYGMTLELRHAFSAESVQAEQTAIDHHAKRVANGIGAIRVVDVGYGQVFANELPTASECTLYRVATYGDDWSRRFIQSLPESMTIDHVQWSRFADVPTSTLHTYHSPTFYLMHDSGLCQEDPA